MNNPLIYEVYIWKDYKVEVLMLLSVVMAAYNAEAFIREAIDSIIKQTHTEFELIIINDGSTDNTDCILNEYKEKDRRIKIFNNPKNKGAAASLNYGIEKASGKWIAIHDADDISFSNRLEEQLKFVINNPSVRIVASYIEAFSTINQDSNYLRYAELGFNTTMDQINKMKYFSPYLCHGSVLFEKKLFAEVGGYNSNYKIAYDYELWLKILDNNLIYKIEKKLYRYRIHNHSLAHENTKKTVHEVWNASTNALFNTLKNQKNKEPRLCVIGDKNIVFDYYSAINLSIRKHEFFINKNRNSRRHKLNIYLNSIDVDGVVVLGYTGNEKIISSLINNNFEHNKNLFVLRNYH